MNGSPLTSNSAVAGVIAATLGERRLAVGRRPGNRLLRSAEEVGQLHPGADDPADGRIGPDADLDRLGLQQPRVRQGVPGGELGRLRSRRDGVYGGYYAQAVNATAPHPYAARLWEEFIYSDQGQLLYLKGFAHPARFNDLAAAQDDPEGAAHRAAVGGDLREGEVREHRAADEGEEPDRHRVADEGRVARSRRFKQHLRPSGRTLASGRRRLSLAWIGTLPFFAYTILFLFLPAVSVLIGAFQGTTGGWTLANIRLLFKHPYIDAYKTSIEISLVTALLGGIVGLFIAYAAIRDGTPKLDPLRR